MLPSFSKNLGPITGNKLKKFVDCEFHNIDIDHQFNELVGISQLKNGSLLFLNEGEFNNNIDYSKGAIICSTKTLNKLKNIYSIIEVDNVQETVASLSNIFYREYNINEIESLPKPKVGDNSHISQNTYIENGAVIGKNVKIGYGCRIGYNTIIGNNCVIEENTIITNSICAENVKIGRNTSIGQQGFGFVPIKGGNKNIYHIGRVIIQANACIGSNCSIDRGSFKDTVIGENTYLDNQCHIAHNVEVGLNCIFAGMCGIAGSAKIGNNVHVGGQSGIAGHITIGNNVRIAAKSGVFESVDNDTSVMGNPAINKFKFIRRHKKLYEQ